MSHRYAQSIEDLDHMHRSTDTGEFAQQRRDALLRRDREAIQRHNDAEQRLDEYIQSVRDGQ